MAFYKNRVTDNHLGMFLGMKSLIIHSNTITGNSTGIRYYNSSQALSKNSITGNLLVNTNKWISQL